MWINKYPHQLAGWDGPLLEPRRRFQQGLGSVAKAQSLTVCGDIDCSLHLSNDFTIITRRRILEIGFVPALVVTVLNFFG
jgi:hypothetical protein